MTIDILLSFALLITPHQYEVFVLVEESLSPLALLLSYSLNQLSFLFPLTLNLCCKVS
jgi:hypothetical protein